MDAQTQRRAVEALRNAGFSLNEALALLRQPSPTLHDRFAMAALTGLLAAADSEITASVAAHYAAHDAFVYADAVLAEKQRREQM